MNGRVLSSCLPVACLAACSSTSNGVVAIEARGAMSIETAAQAALGILGRSGGTVDSDGRGFGAGAAINTTVVDVIGGYDQREYNDEKVPETSIGLRKRFGPEKSPLYVFALARSTQNGTDGEVVFNGTALGLGILVQFHRHWFIDANMAWERTDHLDIVPSDSRDDEGVFQLGLGYSF